jgi:hypothetical protein
MPLRNVEQTYHRLLANPHDVVVSAGDAAEIWKMFKPGSAFPTACDSDAPNSSSSSGSTLSISACDNFKYRVFLQAAMMSWIDGSQAMGFIQTLWTSSVKPNATALRILKALVKEALKQYYKNNIKHEPDLYVTVRNTILQQTRPYFDMISNGLELP